MIESKWMFERQRNNEVNAKKYDSWFVIYDKWGGHSEHLTSIEFCLNGDLVINDYCGKSVKLKGAQVNFIIEKLAEGYGKI